MLNRTVFLVCVGVVVLLGAVGIIIAWKPEPYGPQLSAYLLKSTLQSVVSQLQGTDIRWAVSFGTLLGLVRDGDPIDGDDDIDIVVPRRYADQVRALMTDAGFEVNLDRADITQFRDSNGVLIDFYYLNETSKSSNYDYCVVWEDLPLKLEPIATLQWNGLTINIPAESEQFLTDNYDDWKTPTKDKGIAGKDNSVKTRATC